MSVEDDLRIIGEQERELVLGQQGLASPRQRELRGRQKQERASLRQREPQERARASTQSMEWQEPESKG